MTTPIRHQLVKGSAAAALTLPLLAGGTALASSMGEPEATAVELDQALLDVDTWYGSYTFEELLVLAEEWNLGQLEAKAQATPAILAGDTAEIDAILAAAGPLPAPSGSTPVPGGAEGDDAVVSAFDPVAAAAFWDAGYSYEQLQALADDWQVDEFEAKVRAGQLVLDGRRAEVDHQLAAG